jgi:YD repeat-containing protein
MGRLSQMTSPNYPNSNQSYAATATATYTAASQLSTLAYGGGTYGPQFTETRTYNTLMQLTTLTNIAGSGNFATTLVNMQYNYTAGQNNGRVANTVDGVLNEQVNYTYDMWNRLTAATATNGTWGESYTFDNFGNLTGKTPTVGTAPALSVSVNPATNQQSGAGGYDANGNSLGNPNSNYPNVWDVENRLVTTQTAWLQPITYTYDPWGRRVWKETSGVGNDPNGNPNPATYEIYFYGATGQKLETYSGSYWSGPYSSLEGINIYFGGADFQENDHRFHLKSINDCSPDDRHRSEATLACLILR